MRNGGNLNMLKTSSATTYEELNDVNELNEDFDLHTALSDDIRKDKSVAASVERKKLASFLYRIENLEPSLH